MSETVSDKVPPGFQQLPEGLGFTDNLQPCYRRIEDGLASVGLLLQLQHSNSMGICHGGVLATMADIAASMGVNLARGTRGGTPTVNLAVDFISAARIGQWVQADVQQVTIKRRFGFCNGSIVNGDGLVARFNGTFYLPEHKGMHKGGTIGD